MQTVLHSAPADVVISATDVAKSYGRRHVLKHVSFTARRGQIVGIVGENGAGKTTLLKLLVGLAAPSHGDIAVNGRIGYCPQDCLLFERLTVEENLRYFAAAYGMSAGRSSCGEDLCTAGVTKWLRLGQYRNAIVSDLSAGTRQKLNLAVALLHDPDLLVLDEPYSAFDWETYLLFWDRAGDLRAQGKTIVIVSHLMYDRSKCDQVLTLADGVLTCG